VYFRKALDIDEEIGDRLGQANQLRRLGLVASQRGQARKARQLLNQAKALYEDIGAGGQGPEIVRRALERLGPAAAPGQPTVKPARKRRPRKKP